MMLRLKKTFGFVAAVCMLGVLCGDFVTSNVHAAVDIEEHGKMSVQNGGYAVSQLRVEFIGDPVGTLTITNETTGAQRRWNVRELQLGEVVWSQFLDDPGMILGDTFTVEFAGKADYLAIYGSYDVVFSGAGYGSVSNDGLAVEL